MHRFSSICFTPFVACVSIALAGDLNPPPGPVAPTMKTLVEVEPRTALNAGNTPGNGTYTYVITRPGSYYLSEDTLTVDPGGILVLADNVTIDLNGFTMTSGVVPGANPGVEATVHSGVRVRNGRFVGFSSGVRLGSDAVAADLSVGSSLFGGITVGSVSRVERCLVTDCEQLALEVGGISVVSDCVANGNGIGFVVSADSVVERCVARLNQSSGFAFGENTVVRDCVADNNATDGFFSSSGNTSLTGCISSSNTQSGFDFSTDAVFTGCSAEGNGGDGFTVQARARLTGCMASVNDGDGFDAGTNSSVSGCTASVNGMRGIVVGAMSVVESCTLNSNDTGGILTGDNCTVVGCSLRSNANFGIRVSAACHVRDNALILHPDLGIIFNNDNIISGNSVDGGTLGISSTSGDNRVDGNHVTDCVTGYDFQTNGNLIVRNSAAGNTTDYDIVVGNQAGTIQTSPIGAGPWDNFDF